MNSKILKEFYMFLTISLFWVAYGCDSLVKTGVIQSSFDIKQSKENGVFVDEYIPSKKKVVLHGQEVDIQEAWVEHLWEYKNQKKEIEKLSDTEGYVKIDSESINLFDVEFTLNNRKNGYGGRKLTFTPVSNIDTLNLLFYYGSDTVEILFIKK